MIPVIHWVIVFISQVISASSREIPAVHVVYVSVSVVVQTVTGNLAGVYPYIVSEVRMIIINAGINNGYCHRRVSSGEVPRAFRV